MPEPITIRDEEAGDADHVAAVVTAAFGRADEARLVAALHADGDAAVALVAERTGAIVGYVLLSPMVAPFRALGLAPLAVRPGVQRSGIGRALVQAAVARARAQGWDGIFLLGDHAYYRRFGFSADATQGYDSPYAGPHFQLLRLTDAALSSAGVVAYAPASARM